MACLHWMCLTLPHQSTSWSVRDSCTTLCFVVSSLVRCTSRMRVAGTAGAAGHERSTGGVAGGGGRGPGQGSQVQQDAGTDRLDCEVGQEPEQHSHRLCICQCTQVTWPSAGHPTNKDFGAFGSRMTHDHWSLLANTSTLLASCFMHVNSLLKSPEQCVPECEAKAIA